MMPTRIGFAALFAIAALLLASANCELHAGANKSESKVKASAKVIKTDGKVTEIAITLKVDEGWYIYANPASDDELFAPNKTIVKFKADGKVTYDVTYPPGVMKKTVIAKMKVDYSAYENQTTILAKVQRAAGDTSALKIDVQINACRFDKKKNDTAECLNTGNIVLTIP